MELRLQLLETFLAQGSDGATYKVRAYDRLARDASLADGGEHWEPTGVVEYRLDDGRMVDARADGTLRIAATDITLGAPQAPRRSRPVEKSAV